MERTAVLSFIVYRGNVFHFFKWPFSHFKLHSLPLSFTLSLFFPLPSLCLSPSLNLQSLSVIIFLYASLSFSLSPLPICLFECVCVFFPLLFILTQLSGAARTRILVKILYLSCFQPFLCILNLSQ